MQSSITQHREAVAGRASRVKLMGWWRCKHWQPRWVGLFVDASVTSNNIQNFTAMHVYLRRCQSGSDAADKVGLCCHPFRRSWPWQSWPWQSQGRWAHQSRRTFCYWLRQVALNSCNNSSFTSNMHWLSSPVKNWSILLKQRVSDCLPLQSSRLRRC